MLVCILCVRICRLQMLQESKWLKGHVHFHGFLKCMSPVQMLDYYAATYFYMHQIASKEIRDKTRNIYVDPKFLL